MNRFFVFNEMKKVLMMMTEMKEKMKILVDADACPVVSIVEKTAKKKHHLKGPAKRTEEDDQRFEVSLGKLISVVDRNPLLRQT